MFVGGLEAAGSIGIQPDRVGGANHPRDECLTAGLAGPGDLPEGFDNSKPGGQGHQMGILLRFRQMPDPARFFFGPVRIFNDCSPY